MSKIRNFISFIFSKQFLFQAVLIILVIVGSIWGILAYLNYYTQHGEEITIPDLSGVNKADLKDLLSEKHLRFVIIDSSYNHDLEKGIVIGQNPKPNSKVKKNRTIYVSVNSINPPSVKMPVVIDKSLRQATSVLQNIGLEIGELKYVPDQCVNCVLAQEINGIEIDRDTMVQKGTVIDLVLGGGLSDEKVLVPWIINMTKEEAEEKLKASFLNLGAALYDGSVFDDEDSASARIFAQHPQYSEQSWVYMGSTVNVEFTKLTSKIDSIQPILDSSKFLIQYPKTTTDSLGDSIQ